MSGFLAGLGVDIYPLLSLSLTSSPPLSIAFVSLVGLSLVDRLLGDDDDEDEAEEDDDEDLGAGDDDDFFNADEDLGELDDDDEFGDDSFDDELDQGGGGGSEPVTSDLEPRLDELESEVEGISSTISTVRSENDAIGESVQEVEENVRKLLDIYEMVTRGVNPFVDDAEGQPFDPDSFGLFSDEQSTSDDDGSVDEEVMDADPDSFFNEDFDEDETDDEFDDATVEEVGEDSAEDEFEDEGTAKTFDDLKAEYESEDDEWEAETDDESEGFEFDQVDEEPEGTAEADQFDDFDAADDDEWTDTEVATDEDWSTEESESVAANGGGHVADDDNKPYLTRIPDGYTAELTVLEWMDYLRNNADTAETLRAIEYYRNIQWINDRVADELTEVVMGFERNGHHSTDGEHKLSELTIDDHTHSLQYISQLDGGTVDMELITNWPARGE